ncbi:MAG: chromophore lyase CpcT/CpeT [Phycisphaerales bacterium]|nr:chromophore lyase CpcT/CpeT [Phycisphaerales bacterium]
MDTLALRRSTVQPSTAALVLATIGALMTLGGCARSDQQNISDVRSNLVGSFDSSAQAAADPAAYFAITLHMAEVWPQRTDGPWIYVEQAMADMADKPYRQRVYRLSAVPGGQGRVKSEVFELPGTMDEVQKNYAGAWKLPEPLKGLTPDKLVSRDGCAITLERDDKTGAWIGSTDGNSCKSTLRGASYATSEVTMTQTMLQTWDRGFDASGKQVWGADKGPYIFLKVPAAAIATSQPTPPAPKPATVDTMKPVR